MMKPDPGAVMDDLAQPPFSNHRNAIRVNALSLSDLFLQLG